MVKIDMDFPEACIKCPMLVVHKDSDLYPTYLCKLKWREIVEESVFKERAEFCPIKNTDSSVPQDKIAEIMNTINDALDGTEFEATGYDNNGAWLQVIVDRR